MLQFTCALICFGCGDNSVDFTLSHDHISAFANVFNHEKYSLCDNLDASDAATDDDFFSLLLLRLVCCFFAHLQLIPEHNSLEKTT